MLDGLLPHAACWAAVSARAMFRNEALEGDDAVFLATHSAIRDLAISGSHGSDIAVPTERGLLDALVRDDVDHAFCVVEGEPGSGKSHLIRWLYVNWPRGGRDRALLLQRSDGSLEGALAQLRERLGDDFRHLFEGVGTQHKVGEEGRARIFHSNLRQSLRADHYAKPLEDNDWCAKWHPADFLKPDLVEEKWDAPRRILRLVSGKEGERNSEPARFTIYDVMDLLGLIRGSELGPDARGLYARLVGDQSRFEDMRSQGRLAADVVRELGDQIGFTIAFAAALNRRRNDAIQHVIGVSSDTLKKLFREIRIALKKDNYRLVLLLEDITSWEGLDDSLIDMLVTNADTRRSAGSDNDVCDLVSVVGLTPDYYDTNLRGNYRGRITHQVSLGEGEHGLQDVAMMRDPQDRLRFVGRYLAATRAGPEALAQWRSDAQFNPNLPPPNPCEICSFKPRCHATFDEVDGVGLFPFTTSALDGFFNALKENDRGVTWKTPRGIIQAILRPTLSQPEAIDQATYPGPQIEKSAFVESTRYLSGPLTRLVQSRSEDPAVRERLRRTLTFWGASGASRTMRDERGELVFHDVAKGVFDAFQLPWLGEDQSEPLAASIARPPVTPPLQPEADVSRAAEEGTLLVGGASMEATPVIPLAGTTPTDPKPESPAIKPSPTPRQSRLRLEPLDIQRWNDENRLQNPNEWNQALSIIVAKIDPKPMGIDLWSWSRLVTSETLKIEGTAKERRDILIVPASPWLRDGLEAYASLQADGALPADDVEFFQSRIARLIRHLKREIRSYIRQNLARTQDATLWSPAIAAAQTLLIRAWLRGVIAPTSATADQWVALLSDEGPAESAPLMRTAKWRDLLNATAPHHTEMRALLRESIRLPQGDSKEQGLAAGIAARAIVRLCQALKLDDLPLNLPPQTQSRKLITTSADLAARASDLLGPMVQQERQLLTDRATRLMKILRRKSPRAHGERVDAALDMVSVSLPGAAPDRIRAWKQAYETTKKPLADRTIVEALQRTLMLFSQSDALAELEGASLLAALVTAEAGALEQIERVFAAGEEAVQMAAASVEATIAESGPVAGLDTIQKQGVALLKASETIERKIGKGSV